MLNRAHGPSVPVGDGGERLGDFRTSDRRLVFLSALAVVVGVAGAAAAFALYDLIALVTNLAYYGRLSFSSRVPADTWGWLSIGIPAVGGLVVGVIARFGSERIRGHGIPETIEAVLVHRSKIEPRVALLKPAASAVSIGTGGPFGAEGPIIMTGGALGSLYAQFFHLSTNERKILLVAGAAAGMSAIFNTPVAAALLAVELLLFEWTPRGLLPVVTASSVAAALSWYIVPAHGFGPLFPIAATNLPTATVLGEAALLGLAAGLVSCLLTLSVYFFEDRFRRLPIHWMWWPVLGGAAVGVGGWFAPAALGVGYGNICALLTCSNPALELQSPAVEVGLAALLTLLVVKAVIWSVALGSGTSGGVLAPLMMIGAALGVLLSPGFPGGPSSLWALVGISAMLAGTMRVPFTGVVFAVELTHDIAALPVLLVGAAAAEAVTVLAMRRSILTEKVARRGIHVARDYSVDPLEQIPVLSVLHPDVREVPPDTPVGSLLRSEPPRAGEESAWIVPASGGRSLRFVARSELHTFLDRGGDPSTQVRDAAPETLGVCYPNEPVGEAVDRMVRLKRAALPVVERRGGPVIVGFVTRAAPLEARIVWNQWNRDRERPLTVSVPASLQRFMAYIHPGEEGGGDTPTGPSNGRT